VLDASGSMWNQLADGRYRIVAAKDVLTTFVSGLPSEEGLNVGLRVYGSRLGAFEPGACEDSELFVPMAGVDREALLSTVRTTQAVGATPIALSLGRAAADFPVAGRKLIVLVTDGEESCGGDVRAVAEGLRAQGIQIDLRIIGFDLSERAVASFEGVGTFENATSAAELAAALGRAVETVVPEVAEAEATHLVTVLLTRGGLPAADGARVTFEDAVSGEGYEFVQDAPGTLRGALAAGAYRAFAEDAFGAAQLFGGLTVTPEGENHFAFELAPEVAVTLSVTPADPVAGSTVSVAYEGAPEGERNWIAVVPADAPDEVYLGWAYVQGSSGQVELRIPAETGALEARYHLALPEGGTRVIGRSEAFTPREVEVGVEAPAEVVAGSSFEVTWTGPNNPDDYLTIVETGAPEGSYRSYAYTSRGNPVTLTAPTEPGAYEVRYSSDSSRRTFASVPITVTGADIAVSGPAEVEAGAPFEITWTGPDNQGDYLTIVETGAAEGMYLDYAYTRDGNPATLTAPAEPGPYEIRYSTEQESPNPTLASAPITVVAAAISLEAPAEVGAGESFSVAWTGPDGPQDYLTIVLANAPDGTYLDYAYTRGGSPLTLTAPTEPGAYEIRYASDRVRGTFARLPIRVR
jgi:Ca-activated chloride channel family protein